MSWTVLSNVVIRLLEPIEHLAYKRLCKFPFGDVPIATADEYRKIWAEAKEICA